MSHERHHEADTRLHGRWLVAARVAWVLIALLTLSILIVGLPAYLSFLHTACRSVAACAVNGALTPEDMRTLHRLGISLDIYVAGMTILNAISSLVWTAVGWLIFWRKSNERMALLVALFLVTFSQVLGIGDGLAFVFPAWFVPVKFVRVIGDTLIILFLFLFPNGQFVPRWTRWLALLSIVLGTLSDLTPPGSPFNSSGLSGAILLLLIAFALLAQIYRYRRVSTPVQRQQTKWVVFGVAVAIAGVLATIFTVGAAVDLRPEEVGRRMLSMLLMDAFMMAIPISIGIAVLRARLFDIDVIINRTLVYGSLTTMLALVYLGGVATTQAIFRTLTGQERQPQLAVVISTLVIAALFNPLRRRIQSFIDRRFYRQKYDARKTLESFTAKLRDETDLETLNAELTGVVRETIQPSHISLWQRPDTPTRGEHTS